jgi:hypothetical protein
MFYFALNLYSYSLLLPIAFPIAEPKRFELAGKFQLSWVFQLNQVIP